jgi:hypothetical protein
MADVGEHTGANLMRRTLFVLLAALLPGAASAAPFAEYNPANGDIAFQDVYNGLWVSLTSSTSRLNPSIYSLPVEVVPVNSPLPRAYGVRGRSASWRQDGPGTTYLPFNRLTIRSAIEPYTPLNDLGFVFHPHDAVIPYGFPIFIVPEPATVALSTCGLFGVAAIRRRRATCLAAGRRGE